MKSYKVDINQIKRMMSIILLSLILLPIPTALADEQLNILEPKTITIKTGEIITWYNNDGNVHTITSGHPDIGIDGQFDSSIIRSGESFSYQFVTPGEFDYFCILHNNKIGKVIVQGEPKQQTMEPVYPTPRVEPPETANVSPPTTKPQIYVSIDPQAELTEKRPYWIPIIFKNGQGNQVGNVSFDIIVTQDGKILAEEYGLHSSDGTYKIRTGLLVSNSSALETKVTIHNTDQIHEIMVIPEFNPAQISIILLALITTIILIHKVRS